MFYVAFLRDYGSNQFEHGVLIARAETLEQAAASRHVTGDLIFDEAGNIVQDESWLFPHEKSGKNNYATTKMKNRAHLSARAMEEIGNGKTEFVCLPYE